MPNPITDAIALVVKFEQRSTGGVWPHIIRAELAWDLKKRIIDPNQIDTSNVNLCGPSVFARALASDNPVLYAQAVIDLYESGQGYLGKNLVRPDGDLKQYNPPAGTVSPADWVFLASLRDDENWFLDYQSVGDSFSAITSAGDLEDWFKKAGYRDIKDESNLLVNKDLANAKRASSLYLLNYKVCLLIDGALLETQNYRIDPSKPSQPPQPKAAFYPTHWVYLVSEIDFTTIVGKTYVSAQVHSWGNIMSIPPAGCKLFLESFLNNYYGFVACKY